MPIPKLDSKILKRIGEVLELPSRDLFDRLGSSVIAIVELTSVERAEPADGEERAPTVKLRITGLEVATRGQEDALRRAQQAMHQLRTARGTLDGLRDTEDANRQINLLPHLIAGADD